MANKKYAVAVRVDISAEIEIEFIRAPTAIKALTSHSRLRDKRFKTESTILAVVYQQIYNEYQYICAVEEVPANF